MKRNLLSLTGALVFLAISGSLYAQDKEPKPVTTSGTWALLATLNGFGPFNVTGPSGNGANDPKITEGFGLRYYFGDNWSIRGLASIGTKSVNDSSHSTLWGIGFALEYHLHKVYSTDIYVSGGAGYKSVSTKNLSLLTVLSFRAPQKGGTPQAGEGETNPGDWHANAFGITLAAGFDWYPWNGIALGTEFSLGLVTSSVTQTISGSEQNIYNQFPAQTAFGLSGGSNIHLVVTL